MDMQGTPIGSSNQGTKNTSHPSALHNPKQENPGPIASDSLAAESYRAGGVFSENRNSEPQLVKGSSSTFANTDTSNATTLAPAPYAAEREAKAAWQETANKLRGPGDQKPPSGQETSQESHKTDESPGEQEPSSGISKTSSKPTTAPSTNTEDPKITKDSFYDDNDEDDDSTTTTDIGIANDPSRLAEAEFQRRAATAPGVAATTGPKQTEITNDGQYDVLKAEEGL